MHRPVLYQEVIQVLSPRSGGKYVDCTLGAGGHAWALLQASQPDGRLLGLDLDPQALQLAQERLAEYGDRAIIRRASFRQLSEQLKVLDWSEVDGVMFDLGVSSMQLDTPERGFSFRSEAPLDMRFDPTADQDASYLVNQLPEQELADVLYRYGEEKRSRRVAHAILRARPITSTTQLAEVVASATEAGRQGMHPATRTFQALRIAVNHELEALEEALPQAMDALRPGGRIAVIAFHSLEDRIVKTYFRRESRDCICPPRQPVCTCGHRASLIEVTRQPVRPTTQETIENPRARSARLRVAEKL